MADAISAIIGMALMILSLGNRRQARRATAVDRHHFRDRLMFVAFRQDAFAPLFRRSPRNED